MASSTKAPLSPVDVAKCFASGAVAGVVCDSLLYPLDLCRARLNAPRPRGAPTLPPDPLRALLAISRELRPKPRALYRGFFCVPFFAPAAYGLYFSSYEVASRKTESELAAGLCAEACANPCYIPYDVVKQRYMVGRARGGVVAATRLIVRRDGLRGLYRGFLLTFATYGPFSAIYFWSYDLFTRHMGQYPLMNGTLAGAVAGVATQPVDWLKTRVQVSADVGGSSSRIVFDAIRDEGVSALFRGAAARAFWLGASCGITMQVYESAKVGLGVS